MIKKFIQSTAGKRLTGEKTIAFTSGKPSLKDLVGEFSGINELGLYLHIPFCKYICPYCPYNKEKYDRNTAERYAEAVIKEIEIYSDIVGTRRITSFYIGGGTPTTMMDSGLRKILDHVYSGFDMDCGIHMESHPNDLDIENLGRIRDLGVRYLSIGVEALQERHIKTLKRPYSVNEVLAAVKRAAGMGFECVNVDYIFAVPGQTMYELKEAADMLLDLGIEQVATYPLFRFPYTAVGDDLSKKPGINTLLHRRRMLKILEEKFYNNDYYRSSVWAFTKKNVEKYCSVTVPLYLGIGASSGSYLNNVFYLNTFSVKEYISSLENGQLPVALSLVLTEKMQMAGWLYWRIYETRIPGQDFLDRFGCEIESVYGRLIRSLIRLGYMKNMGRDYVLTDRGSYWLHAFEDLFSINYISRLWGSSRTEPWPDKVILMGQEV